MVWPDYALGDVLKVFKQGKSHLGLVRDVNNEGQVRQLRFIYEVALRLLPSKESSLGSRVLTVDNLEPTEPCNPWCIRTNRDVHGS